MKHFNPQLERNCRRPLDWSDGRASLDSDSNRRHSLVPRLQKPRKARGGAWQDEESWCFCPDGKQVREEFQRNFAEGGGRASSCNSYAGYRGGKRDAERLLPAECEARGTVQGMVRHRSPLQAYCRHFHRLFFCVCARTCTISLITQ